MYGMKMQNDDGSVREATIGEKILLTPVALPLMGICWFIGKKVESEVRKRNRPGEGK